MGKHVKARKPMRPKYFIKYYSRLITMRILKLRRG